MPSTVYTSSSTTPNLTVYFSLKAPLPLPNVLNGFAALQPCFDA